MNEYKTSGIYEDNKALVERIFEEVRGYGIGGIEQALEQRWSTLDERAKKSCIKFDEQIRSDKVYCKLLGVDYFNLPEDDVLKIKLAALYLAKKNPNMVLPLL